MDMVVLVTWIAGFVRLYHYLGCSSEVEGPNSLLAFVMACLARHNSVFAGHLSMATQQAYVDALEHVQ